MLGSDISFRRASSACCRPVCAGSSCDQSQVKFLPACSLHGAFGGNACAPSKLGWSGTLGGRGLFARSHGTARCIGTPVIAWGLRLDRMAMVALGIRGIRDLFSAVWSSFRCAMQGILGRRRSCPGFPGRRDLWRALIPGRMKPARRIPLDLAGLVADVSEGAG